MPTHELRLDDGAVIRHLRRGPDRGLPAVLVPGLTDGLAPLDAEGVDLALGLEVPDGLAHLSGHVVSFRHPLPGDVTVADLAADVVAFVERVVGGPAVLSGHSLGGLVALRVAATRPDLARAVIASGCGLLPSVELDARLRHWEEWLEAGQVHRWASDAVDVASTGSELLRRRIALRVFGVRVDPALVPRHVALSRAVRSWDATQDAAAVSCPTLVMGGTRDPLVPAERVRDLAAHVAGAELEWFHGLAHGFPEQAPRRFADALARFLHGGPHGPALGWAPA